MSEKETHPIRNGIIAAVIAGILLSFWPAFRNLLVTIFKWIWGIGKSLALIIIDHYEIPGWLIFIFILLATPTFFRLIVAFKNEKEPGVYDLYRSDLLFGVLWEWTFNGERITNLWCLCPKCKGELIYKEHIQSRLITMQDHEPDNTTFICENCRRVCARLDGLKDFALGTVKREIRRRIRMGEWKESVEANNHHQC